MNLIWFRKDLRCWDNPALTAACQNGPTIALFIHSPGQWRQHNMAPIQLDFIERNLNALGLKLGQLGIPLYLLEADDFEQLSLPLDTFCQRHGVTHIFANAEPELNEQRRDQMVIDSGLPLQLYEGHCIQAAGSVLNQSGGMFKVFTPFRRRWLEQLTPIMTQPLPAPPPQENPVDFNHVSLSGLKKDSREWPAGEEAAFERLEQFIEHKVKDYNDDRDIPSLDATSGLSPYLACGIISSRQCLHNLLQHEPEARTREHPAFSWLNELVWREFYRHLLQLNPKISMGYNFQPRARGILWNDSEADFQAWCEGKTGYPIVDAAMRQLNQRGWMHNRLRMVVASFLTKHLLVDWRKGEQYFSQNLIDGDLAANNGGWQWAASTGCDAQPYFRIFNPTRQSERFDPDGHFIRHYVPELAQLSARDIHMPTEKNRPPEYPAPIVDHKFARERALTTYSVLKST